jgi:hypothetical protein
MRQNGYRLLLGRIFTFVDAAKSTVLYLIDCAISMQVISSEATEEQRAGSIACNAGVSINGTMCVK